LNWQIIVGCLKFFAGKPKSGFSIFPIECGNPVIKMPSGMGWSPDQLAKMNSLYVRGWIMDYNRKYVAT